MTGLLQSTPVRVCEPRSRRVGSGCRCRAAGRAPESGPPGGVLCRGDGAEIASFAPHSLMYSKRAVQALTEPDSWDDRLDAEFDQCWTRPDFAERQLARAENRVPKFVGK